MEAYDKMLSLSRVPNKVGNRPGQRLGSGNQAPSAGSSKETGPRVTRDDILPPAPSPASASAQTRACGGRAPSVFGCPEVSRVMKNPSA